MKRLFFIFAAVLAALLVGETALLAADTSSTATTSLPIVDPASGNGMDILSRALAMLRLAFEKRSWMIVAGLVLTIVVVLVRMFGVVKRLPAEWVPWGTLLLATGTSVAVGLQSGKSWSTILITGVSIGVVAIGGWESVGKLIQNLIRRLRTPKTDSAPPS